MQNGTQREGVGIVGALVAGLATVEFPVAALILVCLAVATQIVWLPMVVAIVSQNAQTIVPQLPSELLVSDVSLTILIGVGAARLLLRPSARTLPRWTLWLVAFLMWAWLSLVDTHSWSTAFALGRVTLYGVVFLVAALDHRFLKPLVVVLAIQAIVEASLGVLGVTPLQSRGLVGNVGDPHQFGLIMMAGLIGLQLIRRFPVRLALSALLVLAMILTLRRGVWIAGAVELAILSLPSVSRKTWRLAIICVLVALVALWAQSSVSSSLRLNPASVTLRTLSWSEGYALLTSQPAFGYGWAIGKLFGSLPTFNLWLNIGASTGVVGILTFGLFAGSLVVWLSRQREPIARYVLAYVAGFFVLSVGEMTVWAASAMTITFFGIAGAAVGYLAKGRDERTSSPLSSRKTTLLSDAFEQSDSI